MPSPTSVAAARNSAPPVSQRATADAPLPGSRSRVAGEAEGHPGPDRPGDGQHRDRPADAAAGVAGKRSSGSGTQVSISAKTSRFRCTATSSSAKNISPWRKASRAETTARGRGTGGRPGASIQAASAASVSAAVQPAARAAAAIAAPVAAGASASRTKAVSGSGARSLSGSGELRRRLRARLGLVRGDPVGVGHAVDDLARRVLAEGDAALGGRLLVPAGEAVAAEAGEVHQVDVLHVGPGAQVVAQRAEGGGLELGRGWRHPSGALLDHLGQDGGEPLGPQPLIRLGRAIRSWRSSISTCGRPRPVPCRLMVSPSSSPE